MDNQTPSLLGENIGETFSTNANALGEGISDLGSQITGTGSSPTKNFFEGSPSTSQGSLLKSPLFWLLSTVLLGFLILVFIKREKTAEYVQTQMAYMQGLMAAGGQAVTPSKPATKPGPYEKPTHLNSVDEVHVDATVTGPRDNSIEVDKDVSVLNIEPDDSYSQIQASKSSGKKGWCYVGVDRTFRSCVEVGENDQCMSGDIFPTKEVCENPSLRP
jgi:hypothetical protein